MTWAKTLKRVIPFYAVKANPDPVIVNAYANLGLGFDCASEAEIRQIITLGVHPDRIIFAQPRKFESSIEFAKECGVKKMVFDSRDELKKMYNIYPEGEYILRIKTNDTHSSVRLSLKFGANLDYAKELIKLAHQMNAKLVGISFHVGSNCASVDPFHSALVDSAMLFKEAKEKYGIAMNLLDIGGGWPGFNDDVFAKYASVVNADLDSYFDAAVNVIAEPGRFLSSEVEQQVVKVIGTEEIQTGTGELQFEYYLSNGVYQSFFVCVEHQFKTDEILADGICLQPLNVENADKLYKCTLWGPSCDSGDKLLEGVMLPKLCTGDYLYSLHTGAYNNAESTNFNGISKSKPLYYFTLNVK
jgi:ornithine decarboxylase